MFMMCVILCICFEFDLLHSELNSLDRASAQPTNQPMSSIPTLFLKVKQQTWLPSYEYRIQIRMAYMVFFCVRNIDADTIDGRGHFVNGYDSLYRFIEA